MAAHAIAVTTIDIEISAHMFTLIRENIYYILFVVCRESCRFYFLFSTIPLLKSRADDVGDCLHDGKNGPEEENAKARNQGRWCQPL
jgi:hypothetical protein